ncbi:hypothetical protein RvY_07177 [Ramazzottius varieornatus]|uniref:C2H2-type domain-containing protein n=1 Tax=Ramazzottius varieornatus TaxID=947166 RepID=A0A1D1V156_RAMVA|nr:hypothetical protein RvY_07177 [Ramazzottius varieornatus]
MGKTKKPTKRSKNDGVAVLESTAVAYKPLSSTSPYVLPRPICAICKERGKTKSFGRANELRRHVKKYHPEIPTVKSSNFVCQENGCKYVADKRQLFIAHLENEHKIDKFPKVDLLFPSMDVLNSWRQQLNTNTGTYFTQSSRKTTAKGKLVMHLECGRSSVKSFRNRDLDETEHEILSETINERSRLPFKCTAFLRVETQEDGQLSVTGCIGHYGHNPEEDRNRKSSEQLSQAQSTEQLDGEREEATNGEDDEEEEEGEGEQEDDGDAVQFNVPIPDTPASGLRDPNASASTSNALNTRLQYVPAPSAASEFSNVPLAGPERLRLIKASKKIKATVDSFLAENSHRAMVRLETLVQVIGTFD